jgi:hypothetical protein
MAAEHIRMFDGQTRGGIASECSTVRHVVRESQANVRRTDTQTDTSNNLFFQREYDVVLESTR